MSEPITYVGIDAHKADLQVALLAPDATEPVPWTVANDVRAVDRLCRKLERPAPGPIACCYEAGPWGYAWRQMLRQIVAGCEDPQALAAPAQGRLKSKHAALVRALDGRLGQRLMLGEQLQHIEELEGRVTRLSAEIERRMAPFTAALEALDTIPGVGRRTAEEMMAEIGTDMARFPVPATWPRGRRSAWAITRAPASGRAVGPATGTSGCAPP